eukprot:s5301_g5.t1
MPRTRLSAVTLAAGDLLRYAATASQAFFAACLVVQALPAQARYFLPFIPRNAAFITGTGATKIMGPWMGRPAALGGWMMELTGILISHKAFLLLAALSAFPTYRFLWRAMEPSPIPEGETRDAALLPVLAFITLAGVQPVQDLAARAFAAVHLRSIKKSLGPWETPPGYAWWEDGQWQFAAWVISIFVLFPGCGKRTGAVSRLERKFGAAVHMCVL